MDLRELIRERCALNGPQSLKNTAHMGLREMDEHVSKITNRNFDLKLQVWFREQSIGELRKEIEERDRTVSEATDRICQLEAEMKKLKAGYASHPTTAGRNVLRTPESGTNIAVPERTSSKKATAGDRPWLPKPHKLRRVTKRLSDSRERKANTTDLLGVNPTKEVAAWQCYSIESVLSKLFGDNETSHPPHNKGVARYQAVNTKKCAETNPACSTFGHQARSTISPVASQGTSNKNGGIVSFAPTVENDSSPERPYQWLNTDNHGGRVLSPLETEDWLEAAKLGPVSDSGFPPYSKNGQANLKLDDDSPANPFCLCDKVGDLKRFPAVTNNRQESNRKPSEGSCRRSWLRSLFYRSHRASE